MLVEQVLLKEIMRQLLNSHFFKKQKQDQGFTLIEILVALVLIALVLSISISSPFSSRKDLDKEVNSIERAIGFMSDEATLKNAVIRIHFFLDKSPQEYAVEYGPSDSFILPTKPEFETKVESIEEEEKKKKDIKNLNLKFNKVTEFQEQNTELSSDIKIIGVGSSHSEKIQSHGEASLYAFPTGEKDEALVLLANDEDIISLKVNPFSMKIEKTTHPIGKTAANDNELATLQQIKAKEIFDKWLKEK